MTEFDTSFGYEANLSYQAIHKLHGALNTCRVEHEFRRCWDGWQIVFAKGGDIVEHNGSYGHERDLMESMGCPWDDGDVTGYLSVTQVLELMRDYRF